jgi:hypothetical protein
MELIKNKTSYLQNSLNEIRGHIDKAKNLERFKDRDITFKAYVDSLSQIKSNTNDMKAESDNILNSIQNILKNSEAALSVSIVREQ